MLIDGLDCRLFDVDNLARLCIVKFFENCEQLVEVLYRVLVFPVGQYGLPGEPTSLLCRRDIPPFCRESAEGISGFSARTASAGFAAN